MGHWVRQQAAFVLKIVSKNERANLSAAERNALGRLVDELVSIWLTR